MVQAVEIDLIDVTSRMAARLPQYDRIGFASGIYYSKFHDTVVHYATQYLPEGKETFFVCTHGSTACPEKYYAAITEAVKAKNCPILGTFSCRGYDTFGPFKLIGGMANSQYIVDLIRDRVEFIAPVAVQPGEREMESLCLNAYRGLTGQIEIKNFREGKVHVPVF